MQKGPLALYRAKIADGGLKPDPAQALAVEKLQSLEKALACYRPAQGKSGWRERFGLARRKEEPTPPQGLYICGEVGRGKSMLMDMFFATASIPGKMRVHFHEFMRDIHKEIHAWRQIPSRREADPIPRLARDIAVNAWLLCLDELQITDIADAMIVGRLFQALLDNGVVLVITSNRIPAELYKNGLQRERFLPFIALMQERLDILVLESLQDYRLGRLKGSQVYYYPLNPQNHDLVRQSFYSLSRGVMPSPCVININQRDIVIEETASGIAFTSFKDLCGKALGPSDYLAIAANFHTLILTDIPQMSPEMRNEAKRFVTLIDALYDSGTIMIATAQTPPEELYPQGDGSFEFARTVSRLMEMQSEEYRSLLKTSRKPVIPTPRLCRES